MAEVSVNQNEHRIPFGRGRNMTNMNARKLLWIVNDELPAAAGWHETLAAFLTDFDVREVPSITEAHSVLNEERVDCVFVCGSPQQLDPFDLLETLQPMDALLPFVFWHPEMTAGDAVRLIRSGA